MSPDIDAQVRAGVIHSRKQHLLVQQASEVKLRKAYRGAASNIQARILASAGDPDNLKVLMRGITLELERLTDRAASGITTVRDRSSRLGIKGQSDSVQFLKAGYPANYIITPNTAIFSAIQARAIRTLNVPVAGVNLSESVWNTSQVALQRIEKHIQKAFLEGVPLSQVSQEIRRFLVFPDADLRKKVWRDFFKANPPGRGVYRSAYKNAERVLRTETNRAFRLGGAEYAKTRSWAKGMRWNLSPGHPAPDVCLTGGTEIITKKGIRKIEEVESGNIVLTPLGNWRSVVKTYRRTIQDARLVNLYFLSEKNRIFQITATPNHPVLTDQGWIPAGDLKMGCHGYISPFLTYEMQHRLSCDGVRRARQGFVKNVTSQRCGNIAVELYDELPVFQHHDIRTQLKDFLKPTFERQSGIATNRFEANHQTNLDYFHLSEKQKVSFLLQPYAEKDPCDFSHISDCHLHEKHLNDISSNNISVLHRMMKQKIYHIAGRLKALWNEILNSTLQNRSDASCLPRKYKNVYCRSDKLDSVGSAVLFRHIFSHKNEAFHNEISYEDNPFSLESVSCKPRNILNSYINYNMQGRKMPTTVLIGKQWLRREEETVYNLEIEKDNCYFANNIAVHNCDEYAHADYYGLGGGVWPADSIPDSGHPMCICYLTIEPKEERLDLAGVA